MEKSGTGRHQQPRILVVDDDHLLTAVASMALQANAFDVDEAGDGEEALSLIDRHDYDLVILDLEMPNVSGFQVLEEVRAHPRHKHLPIIVVTCRADPVAVERSHDLGATSFEVKPVKWNVMVHHVRFAIRSSQLAAELRTSKRVAEEASQLKGNLLSMISHEFRTPIHAISGFAKLIDKQVAQVPASAALKDSLGEITNATARLNTILSDILLVSSNLCGTKNLREDDHKISDLIGHTVAAFKNDQATSHNIKITSDGSLTDDTELLCDRTMFQRSASHILDNAFKFSPPGSGVTINVRISDQGELICSIKDQGCGMSQSQMEKSLELFSQIDMSSTRSANGLGLGLAISKMICCAHGGRLDLLSVPGEGTEVSLIFPANRVTLVSEKQVYAVA